MTDIIKMAREAGLHSAVLLHLYDGREEALTDSECDELRRLERFAALVRDDERERIIAQNAPEIEKINAHIKTLEEAVAAEREACAKLAEITVCDTHLPTGYKIHGTRVAKAIRERSNP